MRAFSATESRPEQKHQSTTNSVKGLKTIPLDLIYNVIENNPVMVCVAVLMRAVSLIMSVSLSRERESKT